MRLTYPWETDYTKETGEKWQEIGKMFRDIKTDNLTIL